MSQASQAAAAALVSKADRDIAEVLDGINVIDARFDKTSVAWHDLTAELVSLPSYTAPEG